MMFNAKAILIAAPVAAGLLFTAPFANAHGGRGGGHTGSGIYPGATPPVYGAAWAAKQAKDEQAEASRSDPKQSPIGASAAPAPKRY